jgi:structure-specific endonuclease subunit SLX1
MYVYLLYSITNKKYYIGSTNNPLRRLRQHNGLISGGAKYTAKYRPWILILLIVGFTNRHQMLSFEWHWQHANNSKRIIHNKVFEALFKVIKNKHKNLFFIS